MVLSLIDLVRHSHGMLDFRLAGLPREALVRSLPEARSASIAALYVHAVMTEDAFVSEHRGVEAVAGRAQWAPQLPARSSVDEGWDAQARFQAALISDYATAVRAETLEWLREPSGNDLAREVPFNMVAPVAGRWGVKQAPAPLAFVFMDNVVLHTFEHAGEIGVLRGVMGLEGFPLGASVDGSE